MKQWTRGGLQSCNPDMWRGAVLSSLSAHCTHHLTISPSFPFLRTRWKKTKNWSIPRGIYSDVSFLHAFAFIRVFVSWVCRSGQGIWVLWWHRWAGGIQRFLDREGCWADGTESSLTSQQTQEPPPPPLVSFPSIDPNLFHSVLSLTLPPSLHRPQPPTAPSIVPRAPSLRPAPDPTVDQQLRSHIKRGRVGRVRRRGALSYFRISHIQKWSGKCEWEGVAESCYDT